MKLVTEYVGINPEEQQDFLIRAQRALLDADISGQSYKALIRAEDKVSQFERELSMLIQRHTKPRIEIREPIYNQDFNDQNLRYRSLPKGWVMPTLAQQVANLKKVFALELPDFGPDEFVIPVKGFHGVQILPKIRALARLFGVSNDIYGEGYQLIVKLAFQAFLVRFPELSLDQTGRQKYWEGDGVELEQEVGRHLYDAENADNSDFLIVNSSFGTRYNGYNPNAEWEMSLDAGEMPLGTVQALATLVAVPRLMYPLEEFELLLFGGDRIVINNYTLRSPVHHVQFCYVKRPSSEGLEYGPHFGPQSARSIIVKIRES